MENFFKENYSNIVISFFIILFCSFFSIANSNYSNALDFALVSSNIINLPDNNSPQLSYFKDIFTLIIYFQTLLLKLGISIYRISQITLIISSIFFFTGIYLIVLNLIPEWL